MENNLLIQIQELRRGFKSIDSTASSMDLTKALDSTIKFYGQLYSSWSGLACSSDNLEQDVENWLSEYTKENPAKLLSEPQKSRHAKQAMAYFAYHLDLKTKFNGFCEPEKPSIVQVYPMPRHKEAMAFLQRPETDLGYLVEPCQIISKLNMLDLNGVGATRNAIWDLSERLGKQFARRPLTLEELALRALLANWLRQSKQREQERNLLDPSFPINKFWLGTRRQTIAFCMQLNHNGSPADISLQTKKYELTLPASYDTEERGAWSLENKTGLISPLTDGTVEVEWRILVPEKGTFQFENGESETAEFIIHGSQVRKEPWKCSIEIAPAHGTEWYDSGSVETTSRDTGSLGFESRQRAVDKLNTVFSEVLTSSVASAPLTLIAVAGLSGMGRRALVEHVSAQWHTAENKDEFGRLVMIVPFETDKGSRPCVSHGAQWNPDSWQKILAEVCGGVDSEVACIVMFADVNETLVGDYLEEAISTQCCKNRPVKRQTIMLEPLDEIDIQTMLSETLNRQLKPMQNHFVLDPRCGRIIMQATDGYPQLVLPLIIAIVDNLRKKRGWYVSREQIHLAILDLCKVDPMHPEDLHEAVREYVSSRLKSAFSEENEYSFARWLLWQIEMIQSQDDFGLADKQGVTVQELARNAQRSNFQGRNLLNVLEKLVAGNLLMDMNGTYQLKTDFLIYWAKREAREFSQNRSKK